MVLATSVDDVTAASSLPGPTTLISTGPRPSFLISQLAASSPLRATLEACADQPMTPNSFAFAHRGAPLQFPEHTRESAVAAARLGAGTIECDVTFTKDHELVCRHAQNDLHYTTNILLTPLASKCSTPFTPYNPDTNAPATAECWTSDLTLAEWRTLRGKMEGFNAKALTVEEYVQTGTPGFRTTLYAGVTSGTLMTLADSIELYEHMGVRHTPEAKAFVGGGFNWTRPAFVQKILDTYKTFSIPPTRVYIQSFFEQDVLYVVRNEPAFANTAVLLDSMQSMATAPNAATFAAWVDQGIRIWAPPLFALLDMQHGRLVASQIGLQARRAGLDIIGWSLERQGVLANDVVDDTWYYQSVLPAIHNEGFALEAMHVFVQELQLVGLFSDWAGTPAYYANCVGYGHNPVTRSSHAATSWTNSVHKDWLVFVGVVIVFLGMVGMFTRARTYLHQRPRDTNHHHAPLLPRCD
ncbi:hypothetical protein H257_14769 [Aphanomyces astaci]|uniref:glycerophosphodiester phosphodiesterase n=1 Tax=Aphanomyces astaci TaxID=112090 RepID=W4FSC5_APHAT|nr:hypothetical protein H257_14769 [Aphanomyces astaci]ETV69533.1 hypothetical protein H257_14769 [Aphanomyces astaci]RQM26160.1 hypothetical protein B5M09_009474 [Aphanomyces astaci]|eukprot:XP_009840957.1 hypothetical protein H257_14769 [Aphanomyces astaci]